MRLALPGPSPQPETPPESADAHSFGESSGDRIGRYRLLEVIGEGGFGTVWMAEQQETVRRRVALKILKFGMDTREVVARFEAERQALAMMDHPNIARVFDGGATENGRLYFVMELVGGSPLIQFCDEKRLNTRERLELFALICEAVQHAHQKGVIHRDLKPSNILVSEQDGRLVPKVIDFGVAKAISEPLTDKTLFTRFHQFLGTPAYMSPEQAGLGGLDVDTRSDIYSLGVLLYELLAGKPPIDASILGGTDREALFKAIRETEPPKPSTRLTTSSEAEIQAAAEHRCETFDQLQRQLKGELDWIILRAMDKDRARRYQTASGLVADLRNHLKGEAVTAAPPTLAYRFSKIARQHRTALVTGTMFVLMLIVGASATTWQAIRATRLAKSEATQRERAETHLYAAELNVARQAYLDNNLGLAAELVEKHAPNELLAQPPTSLWEWRWLWNNTRSDELFQIGNHGDIVTSAAFSPDGKFVVTGCEDRVTRIWDFTSRRLAASFTNNAGVRAVAYAHKNKWIVATGHGGAMTIWDTVAQRPLHQLTNQGAVLSVAVSKDDRWIAAAAGSSLNLFNPETGAKEKSIPVRKVWWLPGGLAFSPDSTLLAYYTGRGGGGAILDLASGESQPLPSPHVGEIFSMAFTPDGKWLITGGFDGVIKARDSRTGNVQNMWTNSTGFVAALAISPDGRLLATAGADQRIRIYECGTWIQVREFKGHRREIWSLSFSPDGKYLASAGSTDETARIWRMDEPPAPVPVVPPPHALAQLAVSTDGAQILFCYTNGTWNTLDCDSLKFGETRRFPASQVATAAAFGRDGQKAIADAQGSVWLFDAHNRERVQMLRGARPESSRINLFFSPDATALAIQRGRLSVEIIDLNGRMLLEVAASPEGPKAEIIVATFFPGGSKLAIGYGSGQIELYDLKTRSCVGHFNQHRWMVLEMAVSPDERTLVSSGAEGRIKIMDLESKQIRELPRQLATVNSLGFSLEGNRLAAGGGDGNVVVWDIRSDPPLELVRLRDGKRENMLSLFSRDGKFLIGIGYWRDGIPDILIWRAPTWKEIASRVDLQKISGH